MSPVWFDFLSVDMPSVSTGAQPGEGTNAHRAPVSEHFSPFDVQALTLAADRHDIAGIDAITDRLVADGLARARDDVSMLGELRAGLVRRFGRAR